jgi:hypothetical protein
MYNFYLSTKTIYPERYEIIFKMKQEDKQVI